MSSSTEKNAYAIAFLHGISQKVIYAHGWNYSGNGDRYSFFDLDGDEEEVVIDVPACNVMYVEKRIT